VIEERLERLLGRRVISLRRIEGRGYSVAYRAVAALDDGSTVFVKAGTEPVTSEFVSEEIRFYRAVSAPFMPLVYASEEAEDEPLLVLEDLSGGRWPPPWDDGAVAAVRETLAAVAATPSPAWLAPITDQAEWLLGGWAEIKRDPAPFLSLGVCSAAWLDEALPALRNAAESAPIAGDALLHLDVRSDNICLTSRGAVLVDWNNACVGNPDLDVAAWLSSLHLEGGPPPEDILAGAGGYAAALAGFFASRAALRPPETAPSVRRIQLAQLEIALPWAIRELGLRPV
jgi:Phosphotransferase enzyme family